MRNKEYVLDSLFEDIPKEDYNENWCMHKEQVRELLKKGLYGFAGGTLVFGFLQYMVYSFASDSGSLTSNEIRSIILVSLAVGVGCIGFLFGWELINKATGQWSIWGNGFIVAVLFVFKLSFSLLIGMFAYPVVLIYHIIKSQKSKRGIRRWTMIVISAVVLWYFVLGIWAFIDVKLNPGEDQIYGTEPPAVKHAASANEIPMDTVLQIAEKLVSEQQKENDGDPNFNYSDVELYGVFFLENKAWANKNQLHIVIHYNMLDGDGGVVYTYYIPLYIKDIIVEVDGSVSLQRNEWASPFSYSSAEDYIAKFAADYNITCLTGTDQTEERQ